MRENARHNSIRINKQTLSHFVFMMLMLRPSTPALQVLFGPVFGKILNVVLKGGDYILIASTLIYAVIARCIRRKGILNIQAWMICGFISVLVISTIKNGNTLNIRAYYEYLGNIFCTIYLYQRARTNPKCFQSFLKGIAFFFTFAMLLNSLSIYFYYPRGMYTLDDGVSGNNNYYLYALDNVGFIISLCAFGVSAVCDQVFTRKIKRSTIIYYFFIFSAYFYCKAATAILVSAALLVALILKRLGWLKGFSYKWTLCICIISFTIIISIQSFSSFDIMFTMLGKNALLGGRFRIWNAAFKGWLDNFWLGIGIDSSVTSMVLFQHGFVTSGWGNYIGHAHNIVFEILLKSGTVGAIFFCGQLFLCYKKMMENRRSPICQLLCVTFLLFWITSLLDYRIEQLGGWILIMFLYDVELLNRYARGTKNER